MIYDWGSGVSRLPMLMQLRPKLVLSAYSYFPISSLRSFFLIFTFGPGVLGPFLATPCPQTTTPWAIKTCHFVSDNNSGVSWSIFKLFVLVETGRNTLQFTYVMAWWRHNCITSHVTKVCFIQLLHQVKYVEFEDRPKLFVKNLWKCENVSHRRLIKEFSTKNWKRRTLDKFMHKLLTTGSIERIVMIDFKMCCLYVVLVLPGSVET